MKLNDPSSFLARYCCVTDLLVTLVVFYTYAAVALCLVRLIYSTFQVFNHKSKARSEHITSQTCVCCSWFYLTCFQFA